MSKFRSTSILRVVVMGALVAPGGLTSGRCDEARDKVLQATNPPEMLVAFDAWIKAIDASAATLMLDAHPTIAILGAWRQCLATVEATGDRHAQEAALTRFVEFVETHVGAHVPDWWRDQLFWMHDLWNDEHSEADYPLSEYEEIAGGLRLRSTATMKYESENVVLSVGDESVSLPRELLDKELEPGSEFMAVGVTPCECAIVTHSSAGFPYRLTCIGATTKDVRWRADVWSLDLHYAGGVHSHQVDIVENADQAMLIVFGAASGGCYVEAFDRMDGSNRVRFATYFCDERPRPRGGAAKEEGEGR